MWTDFIALNGHSADFINEPKFWFKALQALISSQYSTQSNTKRALLALNSTGSTDPRSAKSQRELHRYKLHLEEKLQHVNLTIYISTQYSPTGHHHLYPSNCHYYGITTQLRLALKLLQKRSCLKSSMTGKFYQNSNWNAVTKYWDITLL